MSPQEGNGCLYSSKAYKQGVLVIEWAYQHVVCSVQNLIILQRVHDQSISCVYKLVSTPFIGETLSLSPENGKENDPYQAMAVIKDSAGVGHAPRELN